MPTQDTLGRTDVSALPLIDVALPTYGPVPYLREAIDSVLAQTERRWRLTLVDNSPETGGARAVLEPYRADPRVHYLATGGLAQHANWTAALTSGDAPYFALLSDDDWWEPEFLARRLAFLEAHPGCAFVFSNYREVDEAGNDIAHRAPRLTEGVHEPRTFAPLEYAGNLVPVASPLYRRSAIREAGEYFADVRVCDYELWMRLASRFPVGYLDVRDCAGRLHAGSETSAIREQGRTALQTVDYLDAAVDQVDPALVPRAARHRRRAGALLTCALDAMQAGDVRQARIHLRGALRLHPAAIADPRVPVLSALLALGSRGGTALARARDLQERHHIRIHADDVRKLVADLVDAGRRRSGAGA
jgi:hypothetical protein